MIIYSDRDLLRRFIRLHRRIRRRFHQGDSTGTKRYCPWSRRVLLSKRQRGSIIEQTQRREPQVRAHGLMPTPVPVPSLSRAMRIPPPIPPPVLVDPQEAERCRASWEFPVIYSIVRGSDLCRHDQDIILDFISDDAGAFSGNGSYGSFKPGYPLPPRFDRRYLDYLVNGVMEPDTMASQASCPLRPARPPTPTPSPMPNLAPEAGSHPRDPSRPKKVRFTEQLCSDAPVQSGSIYPHLNPNPEGPIVTLFTPLTAPIATTPPSPSPTPSSGNPAPRRRIAITPTMYRHYRSFRSIIRVIQAQAKIWILTRPDDFRKTLHTRWMSGLPEDMAMRLWFACQGRYTVLDLATEREFATGRTADGHQNHGTAYMTMIRRYFAAVADGGASHPLLPAGTTRTCTCPGAGWYRQAVATTPSPAPRLSYASREERERLLNEQVNRFLTSNPSPSQTGLGPYLDPRITSLLTRTIPSPELRAKLDRLDWMSMTFLNQNLRPDLLSLAHQGRWKLHGVLRALYQELAMLYREVEPDVPCLLSRPFPEMKPFTFRQCALYLDTQLQISGAKDLPRQLKRSFLTNQPWDWPVNWNGDGETFLHGPAQEVRLAIEFLVRGASQWLPTSMPI